MAKVFKYLICPECNYKKVDPTGKASSPCKNDKTKMYLSSNWFTRMTHKGITRVRAHTSRKKDAEDFVATCQLAVRSGSILPGEEENTGWPDARKNALKWWSDAVTRNEIRQSTARFYRLCLVPLDRYFADKALLTISKRDIIDYQTSRARSGRSNVTINHEITTLRRVYSLHLERTTAEESPRLFAKSRDLSSVPKLIESSGKSRVLTAEEARLLLASSTPDMRLAILIGLNTGLRKSNVLELTWNQINFKERLIKLPGTAMKNRKAHTVDIPATLQGELLAWRKTNINTSTVFSFGTAFCNTFQTEFRRTIKISGLAGVTYHTLRHTFASQFLMTGGDVCTLSEILGHSDISITKNIYGHLSREHKRKAVEEFTDAFLSQI